MTSAKQIADQLCQELNLGEVGEETKKQIYEQILDHFSQVVVSTMISYMNEEQFERFKKALNAKDLEAEVALIAAEVPGLADAIDKKIDDEYKIMKAVMNN